MFKERNSPLKENISISVKYRQKYKRLKKNFKQKLYDYKSTTSML